HRFLLPANMAHGSSTKLLMISFWSRDPSLAVLSNTMRSPTTPPDAVLTRKEVGSTQTARHFPDFESKNRMSVTNSRWPLAPSAVQVQTSGRDAHRSIQPHTA